MRILIQNIFISVLFLTSQIFSQQFTTGSPEWLVDMFFSKTSFPDKADYFSGEMLNEIDEPTIGEELKGFGDVSFHQIKAANDNIAFAIQVTKDQSVIEFYCYLVQKDNNWKINAVRRFLLPSFIYTVRDSLAELKTLSSNDSTFYLSLQLFTSSDDELKDYLKINLEKFNKLVSSINDNDKDRADKFLSSVGCNAIFTDKKYPGCTFIQILKLEDIEVGFINAAEKILLPEISVNDFIYIEDIVPGWYLFRVM